MKILFQAAHTWFKNLDKLIKYINNRSISEGLIIVWASLDKNIFS